MTLGSLLRRLLLLSLWPVVGEPLREEAQREARKRLRTDEQPAPAAEARIRERWKQAEQARQRRPARVVRMRGDAA